MTYTRRLDSNGPTSVLVMLMVGTGVAAVNWRDRRNVNPIKYCGMRTDQLKPRRSALSSNVSLSALCNKGREKPKLSHHAPGA